MNFEISGSLKLASDEAALEVVFSGAGARVEVARWTALLALWRLARRLQISGRPWDARFLTHPIEISVAGRPLAVVDLQKETWLGRMLRIRGLRLRPWRR